jgi:hypothetical protein
MESNCKETLINYLSDLPSSKDEVEKLVGDRIISKEEAAVLNMRIAAQKLDEKVNSLLQKVVCTLGEDADAGLDSCAGY